MTNSRYIRFPFASSGDTQTIPDDVQQNGSLSWTEGWGPDYQLDLTNDPAAKAIERKTMNQLFYVITTILQHYQTALYPEWIQPADNNGQAFAYPIGATVRKTNSSNVSQVWTNQRDNNTNEPGTTSSGWTLAVLRTANSSEIKAKKGDFPITPQQAIQLFNATISIPEGSTSKKGIVQLSDAIDSISSALAATPNAVSYKLTQHKQALGTKDLDTLNAETDRGLYFQTSNAQATTARHYPDGAAGILLVAGSVNNAAMQIYFSINGKVFTRNVTSSGGAYGAWRDTAPAVAVGSLAQRGVVQLSDAINSTSSSYAATPNAVSQKLTYNKTSLGTTNLDTLVSASQIAVYYQNSTAAATVERNYPIARAGVLHVLGDINGAPMQIYTPYVGAAYSRSRSGGAWRPWSKVQDAVPTATTSRAGIVQLSDSLVGTSSTRAATEKAVSQKLTYNATPLTTQSINNYNKLSNVGLYVQNSNANATAARGYPITAAGVLEVFGRVNNLPLQRYTTYTGKIFTRYLNSSSVWQPWVNASISVDTATTSAAGIVQLSDELYGTRSNLAATEKAVGSKLNYNSNALGGTDLNSLTSKADVGLYYQVTSTNATIARGYPVVQAGWLAVVGVFNGWPMQTYTTIQGDAYTRTRTTPSSGWGTWQLGGASLPPGIILPYATSANRTIPGTLLCNGIQVERAKYQDLFNTIGTRYGTPSSATMFKLPAFRNGDALLCNGNDVSTDIQRSGAVIKHSHNASSLSAGNHKHTQAFGERKDKIAAKFGYNDTYGSQNWGIGDADKDNTLPYTSTDGAHTHPITVTAFGGAGNFAAGQAFHMCITY